MPFITIVLVLKSRISLSAFDVAKKAVLDVKGLESIYLLFFKPKGWGGSAVQKMRYSGHTFSRLWSVWTWCDRNVGFASLKWDLLLGVWRCGVCLNIQTQYSGHTSSRCWSVWNWCDRNGVLAYFKGDGSGDAGIMLAWLLAWLEHDFTSSGHSSVVSCGHCGEPTCRVPLAMKAEALGSKLQGFERRHPFKAVK